MRRFSLILLSLLFFALTASAQRARFDIRFSSKDSVDLSKVYVQPLDGDGTVQAVPLRLKGEHYSATLPVSQSGFYEVVMVINGGQWLTTVYAPKCKKVWVDVEFDGVSLKEYSSVDNMAISMLPTTHCVRCLQTI